jgi:hypothetical protein
VAEQTDVVVLDAGGAPGGTSAYQQTKFEAILRGELNMDIEAHNLGGPEAALGADYLRRTGRELSVPFISANARDAAGELIAEPYRIITRGSKRIAVVGVLSRRYADAGLRIDDPRQAVVGLLAGPIKNADALVVLAYLPEEELRQFAAGLPEVDVIIGGPTRQSLPPSSVGPTLLAAATNKGKFLVHLEMASGPARATWSGRVVEMDASIGDDARQLENLDRYREGLVVRDFSASETGLATPLPAGSPADYQIAGAESCLRCHASEAKQWRKTEHAIAWDKLAGQHSFADPFCQQCHTTGYGLPGGFMSVKRSATLVDVGCESCHGPSLAHSRNPQTRTAFDSRDQCTRCHDHENSPKFDFMAYWPKIAHGKSSAPSARDP